MFGGINNIYWPCFEILRLFYENLFFKNFRLRFKRMEASHIRKDKNVYLEHFGTTRSSWKRGVKETFRILRHVRKPEKLCKNRK